MYPIKFVSAKEFKIHEFKLSGPIIHLMNNEIHELKHGLNIISSNTLKELNKSLHWILIDAWEQKIPVIMVDVANIFNPHRIPDISRGFCANDILKNIKLSRPFQGSQSLSILNHLIKNLIYGKNENQLVIITSLDRYLYENKDTNEFYNQLLHILFGLKRAAVRGNTILITNKIRKYQKLFTSTCNLHVEIRDQVHVLKHPDK